MKGWAFVPPCEVDARTGRLLQVGLGYLRGGPQLRCRFVYVAGFVILLALFAAVSFTLWPRDAGATDSPDPLCIDANGNGVIDKEEVIAVINAYLFGPAATPAPTPTPSPQDGTTRSKAYPYGQRFQAGIFDIQITAIDWDAWPEIQAENQFNDPPAEGYRFVMWTMDVENVRGSIDYDERATYRNFKMVGSRNVQYYPFSEENNCGVVPDELNANLYLGGQATGNVCLSVPIDETRLTFLYDALHEDADGDSFFVEVWFKGEPE